MKLTTKKLKQMIREALSEVHSESMDHGEMAQRYYPQDDSEMRRGTQFGGELAVTTEELPTQAFAGREQTWAERKMGHWRIQGNFNGREINIDSKELYGGKPTNIEQWEDTRKSRYAMARELTGHLKMAVRAFDLNNVHITVNGKPVNKAKDYSHL